MKNAKKADVLFVVVGWNNKKLLAQCFDSIRKQSYRGHRTVYVDNGSIDDSVAFTKKNYPEVEVIANEKNFGFAKANNMGIANSITNGIEYVALVNTDATLNEHWLERIVAFAKTKPKVACMQGTTLDFYNHNVIDSTHIYISRNGSATQANWREYYRGELGPLKVFGVNAAAAVYSADFIREQHEQTLFDESLFMYLEDVDVAIRSTLTGWDNYLVPGARAYHMGSASSAKQSTSFSLYYTYRNNSAILVKNLPLRILVKIFPRAIKSDYLTIKHLIRTGSQNSITALIKGRFVSIIRAPLYVIKRIHKPRVKISAKYMWSIMNRGY